MTLSQTVLNLLFGLLAFFIIRYLGNMVLPDGVDKIKIINILGILAGVIVFFLDLAVRLR